MSQNNFVRPHPALTPAQRYYLDTFGYVVVPNTLTPDECGVLREALQKLKRDMLAAGNNAIVRNATYLASLPHHTFMGTIIEADPAITAYTCHPRLVGMAEELMGNEARIVEANAHINSRNPAEDFSKPPRYGFHRGTDIPFGSHTVNGLYHCSFVKTLTNLTDLGPDDGGTVVIVGSHKIDAPTEDIIKCTQEDPRLIHQVIAPAGSTLLFNETTIHATGRISSDKERVVIICGYGPTLFPYWESRPMSEEFKKTVPEPLHALFNGRATWTRGEKYRKLGDPVDTTIAPRVAWNGSAK